MIDDANNSSAQHSQTADSSAADKKREKAERLANWRPFDVHRWSDYPEVNNAVNAIYKDLKANSGFSGHAKLQKKHIKVVTLDLYVKWLTDPAMYAGVYFRSNEYKARSRYNAIHVSELTPKIIKELHAREYLDLERGFFGRDGHLPSFMTRIRATEKMVDLFRDNGWTEEMVQDAKDRECIELRDYDSKKKKQVPIDYDDTPDTHRMREALTKYNNLTRWAHIDVPGFPVGGMKKSVTARGKVRTWIYRLDRNQKFTKRIFSNGTWDNGGRFYGGWWQQIPNSTTGGAWRKKILINGNSTIEIDYSGLHIVLLYALKGIDYWAVDGKDPYSLPRYGDDSALRQLLKLLLLIAINAQGETEAEQRKKALQALKGEINAADSGFDWVKGSGMDLGALIDDFSDRHKPIADQFFTGAGTELQLLDSRIAEHVIDRMTEDERVVLTVHDSFICQEADYPALLGHMDDAYAKIVGELFPGLETAKSNLKFVSKLGEMARKVASDGHHKDSWALSEVKEEEHTDQECLERFEAWKAKRLLAVPAYYTAEKQAYTVSDTPPQVDARASPSVGDS